MALVLSIVGLYSFYLFYLGATPVLGVFHQPEMTARFCTRVIAIKQGRIVYDGQAPTFKAIEATKDVEVCGKSPIPAVRAVIKMGLNRSREPRTTVSKRFLPSA